MSQSILRQPTGLVTSQGGITTHFRIRKLRLAAMGLFVLAGVGLGSLLSPLIGTALATVGQVVNISDNSASANFARLIPAEP